jgi:hypothetical protein
VYAQERRPSRSSATTTANHDEVRKWAEERGGRPTIVADTDNNGREGGIPRIDFKDWDGEQDEGLEAIGWDRFFKIFDENDLAFLHSGDGSRFNKFVSKEKAGS